MTTNTSSLASRTAAQLRENGEQLEQIPALLGFDGFIDTILHVVDTRKSASEYTRVKTIDVFSQKIAAAAGKSTNIELVQQAIKLGGNGPIMANALCAFGVPMTYCGLTGYPNVNEVFREFSRQARLLPLADPALTDAIEFDDGKLIVGKHATVAQVSYENILERVGEDIWRDSWDRARFVGMENWTMLPYLTDLWKKIQADIAGMEDERKVMFFDLADPEKRTREDLLDALQTLAHFQTKHDVILGLNEKEAMQVGQTLGVNTTKTGKDKTIEIAAGVRERLNISICVVHPTEYAAAADANGTAVVDGPYTPQPKISTGAGDHFNAGFCVGQLIGSNLEQSLQLGVATSGYYVRNAASPDREQLADFLEGLG